MFLVEFEGVVPYSDPTFNKHDSGNGYYYWWDADGNYRESYYHSFFSYSNWYSNSVFVNNRIYDFSRVELNANYHPVSNISIEKSDYLTIRGNGNNNSFNSISNIGHAIEIGSGMNFSNYTGEFADYVIRTSNGSTTYDYTNNYWGKYTSELYAMSSDSSFDASFIYDGYDNTDYSVANIANYASEPWSFAGYHGDAFVSMEALYSSSEVKRGSDVTIAVKSLTDNQIDRIRVAQSLEGLLSSEFRNLIGNTVVVPYS